MCKRRSVRLLIAGPFPVEHPRVGVLASARARAREGERERGGERERELRVPGNGAGEGAASLTGHTSSLSYVDVLEFPKVTLSRACC